MRIFVLPLLLAACARAPSPGLRLANAGMEVLIGSDEARLGSLRLTSDQRGGPPWPLCRPSPTGCTPEIHIDRRGFVESWRAVQGGLEQWWTVAAPLGDEVVIEVGTSQPARVSAESVLVGDLRVDHLLAWDATARVLASRFEARPAGFAVRVDTRGAVPPVVIDPTYAARTWEVLGDSTTEQLGDGMDAGGDADGDGWPEVIVGAVAGGGEGEGDAQILWFPGGPAGLPVRPQAVLARGRSTTGGRALAFAGDVDADGYDDIVGHLHDDQTWAIALFRGGPLGPDPTPTQLIPLPLPTLWDGESISDLGDVDGDGYADVATVGYDTIGGLPIVWVLHGGPGGLDGARVERIDPTGRQGVPVVTRAGDVDGDGLDDIVFTIPGSYTSSPVYFTRGRPSLLPSAPDLLVAAPVGTTGFARSIAGVGDLEGDGFSDLLVGCPDGGAGGGVYVLSGGPAGPGPPTLLLRGDRQLGWAVADAGDINGDGFPDGAALQPQYTAWHVNQSAIHVIAGSGAGPRSASIAEGQIALSPWDAVAGAGDVDADGFADMIVHSIYGEGFGGRVLLLRGGPGPTLDADRMVPATRLAGVGPGSRVVAALDLDVDGYSDLFVAEPMADGLVPGAGRVQGWRGGPDGLQPGPAWHLPGNVADGELGAAMAVGDVDGDSLQDLVVGEPGAPGGGRVGVLYGIAAPSGVLAPFAHGQPGDRLGASLAIADLDGDGQQEVITGSPDGTRAFVAAISSGGAPVWTASGPRDIGWGAQIATGDVNADGLPDVIVYATNPDTSGFTLGRVDLFASGGGRPATTATWSGADRSRPIVGVAAPDLSGDGIDDLVLVRYGDDADLQVHDGGPAGPAASPDRRFPTPDGILGAPSASGGDLDLDGRADLLIPLVQPWLGGGTMAAWLGGRPASRSPDVLWPSGHEPGKAGFAGDVDGDAATDVWTLAESGTSWELDVWYGGLFPSALPCGPVRLDTDGDGRCDAQDEAPTDPLSCGDGDRDGCPDCSSGVVDPRSDGPDLDADGRCDPGDPDVDGDGVSDAGDPAPSDGRACGDADLDGCEDCTSGWVDLDADGADRDADGICDATDADPDGDGVAAGDADPVDPYACRDSDADGCDDCSSGRSDPGEDGPDPNGNGLCARTDPWETACPPPLFQVTWGDRDGLGLGASAGQAGDVDGDGWGDVIAVGDGAWICGEDDCIPSAEGGLRVLRGGPPGLAGEPLLALDWADGDRPVQKGRGDCNGDGFDDLVVGGLPPRPPDEDASRRTMVLLGGPGGPDGTPDWTWSAPAPPSGYTHPVTWVGDLDGDGFDELAVTVPVGHPVALEGTARVLLFRGGPEGTAPTPAWVLASGVAGDGYGIAVIGLGDLDRDGWGDLAVGAPGDSGGRGAVFVHRGSATGPRPASWAWRAAPAGSRAGGSLAAGDLDGDGDVDLAVGNGSSTAASPMMQRAWWFRGAGRTLEPHPARTWRLALARGWTGVAVGDRDGDGDDDLVAVVSGASDQQDREGIVSWLDATGSSHAPLRRIGLGRERLSPDHPSLGDIDGDGLADLLIGVTNYSAGGGHGALLQLPGAFGLPPEPALPGYLHDATGQSLLGAGITSADVNGDGHPDLVASTKVADPSAYGGDIRVWHGGHRLEGDPDEVVPAWGYVDVASIGDIDGDGNEDVATWRLWGSEWSAHKVRLLAGSPTGLQPMTAWNSASRRVPDDVAALGDVNGDGYGDLGMVGGSPYGHAQGPAVWYGGPGRPSVLPDVELDGPADEGWPKQISRAGDVDGDGFADIVAGSAHFDCWGAQLATLHRGGPAGPELLPSWTWHELRECMNVSAVGAGDLDGDGYDDLVVASTHIPDPWGWRSRVAAEENSTLSVFLGGPGGLATEPHQVIPSAAAFGADFGQHLRAAGDVDADGHPDLLVHVPGSWRTGAGAAIFHGAAGGLDPEPSWVAPCSLVGADYAAAVGDLDADGRVDLAIGMTTAIPDSPAGRIHLFYGSASGPLADEAEELPIDSGLFPIAETGAPAAPDTDVGLWPDTWDTAEPGETASSSGTDSAAAESPEVEPVDSAVVDTSSQDTGAAAESHQATETAGPDSDTLPVDTAGLDTAVTDSEATGPGPVVDSTNPHTDRPVDSETPHSESTSADTDPSPDTDSAPADTEPPTLVPESTGCGCTSTHAGWAGTAWVLLLARRRRNCP